MIRVCLSVRGQDMAVTDKPKRMVAGTRGMVRLMFSFDSSWDGFRAVADFGDAGAAPIKSGSCVVPDGAADGKWLKFRVVGERDGARVTTNNVKIEQEVS